MHTAERNKTRHKSTDKIEDGNKFTNARNVKLAMKFAGRHSAFDVFKHILIYSVAVVVPARAYIPARK